MIEYAMNHSFLDIWGERMFTASWQGGLLLAIVWIVSRYWKRVPAVTRCWIWRIAYVKFAIVLLFGCLLPLPILPAPFENAPATAISGERGSVPVVPVAITQPSVGSTVGSVVDSAVSSSPTTDVLGWESSRRICFAIFFVIWVLGCCYSMVRILRHLLMAKRMVANSIPLVDQKLINRLRVLCAHLKMSKAPTLTVTTELKSPVLVGGLRPTVLIPESILESCESDELGLIVAHELAHVKRRDLWWNWIPVLVRMFFFFHPLVWLTQSRYALDQEIACDCMALDLTNAQFKNYGNVLVKVSTGASPRQAPTLASIGVASSFKTLKSRILEMDQFSRQQNSAAPLLSIAVLVFGLCFAAPFNVVAQQEDSDSASVKETATATVTNSVGVSQGTSSSPVAKASQNESSVATTQSGSTGSVSISVNKDGRAQSIQIKSNQNGTVDVTYSDELDGQKEVKKYRLDDIELLSGKNKQAYEFYKNHATGNQSGSVTRGSGNAVGFGTRSGSGGFGFGSNGFPTVGSSGSNQMSSNASDSSSNSSSSSAWQKSTSTNINGKTTNTQSSGTTGNGMVGGGNSKQQMVKQINQMILQTDNPQMKSTLRQLLQQIGNN